MLTDMVLEPLMGITRSPMEACLIRASMRAEGEVVAEAQRKFQDGVKAVSKLVAVAVAWIDLAKEKLFCLHK